MVDYTDPSAGYAEPDASALATATEDKPQGPLLEVTDLRTFFRTAAGTARAVDGISFTIKRGETFAIVGESGCGKSVTALSIMQLVQRPSGYIAGGSIKLNGHELIGLPEYERRKIRGNEISMIFQEPMTSLNPVFTIGSQIVETIRQHNKVNYADARDQSIEMLDKVRIPDPDKRFAEYPHQLSGGMRQRVMIAIALACKPKLLIADEPTTALDVTIQAQILDLIGDLQRDYDMSVLLITHDLGVVRQVAEDIAVMYAGKIVETADRETLFGNPQHPYTNKLFKSIPSMQMRGEDLETIRGTVPLATEYPDGCRFAGRCDQEMAGCSEREPKTFSVGHEHVAACHLFDGEFVGEPVEQAGPVPHRARARQYDENAQPLLAVRDLKVHFPIRKGLLKGIKGWVYAVDGVSFAIPRGSVTALVGESGCGKTTVGKGILGLLQDAKLRGAVAAEGHGEMGSVTRKLFGRHRVATSLGIVLFVLTFLGAFAAVIVLKYTALLLLVPFALFLTSLLLLSWLPGVGGRKQLRGFRADYQIIFQDPYSSLNPRQMVGEILGEGMAVQKIGEDSADRERISRELLETVKLDGRDVHKYPHEFSGGQRQRIGIARALAVDPEFIVCDEATSALDVSVQAQILNLLAELQEKHGLTFLFITHNMSVVQYLADEVCVMYLGRIVERGRTEEIFLDPRHPYTRALLDAVPHVDAQGTLRIKLEGDVPSPIAPPAGCHFHPRCLERVEGVCDRMYPGETDFTSTHACTCFRWSAGHGVELPADVAARYFPEPLDPYVPPHLREPEEVPAEEVIEEYAPADAEAAEPPPEAPPSAYPFSESSAPAEPAPAPPVEPAPPAEPAPPPAEPMPEEPWAVPHAPPEAPPPPEEEQLPFEAPGGGALPDAGEFPPPPDPGAFPPPPDPSAFPPPPDPSAFPPPPDPGAFPPPPDPSAFPPPPDPGAFPPPPDDMPPPPELGEGDKDQANWWDK